MRDRSDNPPWTGPLAWIVSEDATELTLPTDEPAGLYLATHKLDRCLFGCARSYRIVTQLLDPPARAERMTYVELAVDKSADQTAEAGLPPVSLALDPEAAISTTPSAVRGTLEGALMVDQRTQDVAWEGTLSLAAEGLPPGAGSMVGVIWLRGDSTYDYLAGSTVRLAVGDRGSATSAAGQDTRLGVEWLTSCPGVGEGCQLPVRVELSRSCEGVPDCTLHLRTFNFRLDARLVFFDLAEPPSGAALEVVKR